MEQQVLLMELQLQELVVVAEQIQILHQTLVQAVEEQVHQVHQVEQVVMEQLIQVAVVAVDHTENIQMRMVELAVQE